MSPWFNHKIMLSQNRRNSNKKKRVKIYITPAWRNNINNNINEPLVQRSVHTSAKLIFHFSNKTEKGNITYPYHIYTFYSTDKNRKKENGQEN